MKLKFVITSIISIAAFVGIASAQQVQVFDANFNGGVYVGLSPVSPTSGPVYSPNVSAFAGQTVRLRIAATNNRGTLLLWGIPTSPSICSPSSPFSTSAAATQGRGVFLLSTSRSGPTVLNAATDPAWKGTCRILTVRLGDGSQHIGRIFFQ